MGIFILLVVLVCALALLCVAIAGTGHSFLRFKPRRLLERIANRYRTQVVNHQRTGPYLLIKIKDRHYRTSIKMGGDGNQVPFLSISAPIKEQALSDLNVSDPSTQDSSRANPNNRESPVSTNPSEKIEASENPDDAKPQEFRMSLVPQLKMFRKQGLLNLEDIEVGNPRFDNLFLVRSNQPKQLLDVLTRQSQELILRIRRQSFSPSFEIRVIDNQLQLDQGVDAQKPIKAFVAIRLFSELHALISHALSSSQSIDMESVHLFGDTRCLICGELVEDRVVECRSCMTLYHRECWEYVGKCGRYACGQTVSDSRPSNSTRNTPTRTPDPTIRIM